jgi:hypothetical protein
MQNRSVIYILLAIVAVFSLGLFFINRTLQQAFSPKPKPEVAEASPNSFWGKKAKQAALKPAPPVVVYKTNQFRWTQIESTDYREYIANLRSVGCPEPTIRDIIITDIMRLYAARRGQFYHNGREFKFWETDDKRKLKAKQLEEREKQLASIDKEIPTVLRELLGINYERELNKYFVDTDEDNRRLSFLPQEKREAIIALRDEIEGLRENIPGHDDLTTLNAEQLKELEKIEKHRREKLARILSGPELDQFELSTSETADRLRKNLTGFNPTEDEFRELFRLFKEHDDKFALASPNDEKLLKDKAADEERIEGEILSKLSVSRAQEYTRTKNEEFRNMAAFTEIYELPPNTAQSLFEIQQAVKEEKEKLLGASLTTEEKAEGLKAIQGETEKTVRKLLGEQLYGKFTQSSGAWIPKLTN